jgi:hypothetical protein
VSTVDDPRAATVRLAGNDVLPLDGDDRAWIVERGSIRRQKGDYYNQQKQRRYRIKRSYYPDRNIINNAAIVSGHHAQRHADGKR